MEGILGTHVVTQIGFIVKDIDAVSEEYSKMLGLPKPEANWTAGYSEALTRFYGKPTEARSKLAFLHVGGNLDIELIQPDEKESVWRKFLDEKGEGVQHIAFVVKDGMGNVLKRLNDAGCETTMCGEYTGGRYAYVDTFNKLKVDIELLEND